MQDKTCSAASLLALKNMSRPIHSDKPGLFNAKSQLLLPSKYVCTFGLIDFSIKLDSSSLMTLTLTRCCDLIGGRIELTIPASARLSSISTSIFESQLLDTWHVGDNFGEKGIAQVGDKKTFDLARLAPFHENNVIFPATRRWSCKILLEFDSPLPAVDDVKLYGMRYFVAAEERINLFKEDYSFATWVNSSAREIPGTEDTETQKTFMLTNESFCDRISIHSNDSIKNVRLALTGEVDLYNGPAWPLLSKGPDANYDVYELQFSDSLEAAFPDSWIDFKSFPDARLILTGTFTDIDSLRNIKNINNRVNVSVVGRCLEFVKYSAESEAFVKIST